MRHRARLSDRRSHPGNVRGIEVRGQPVPGVAEVAQYPGIAGVATVEHPAAGDGCRREIDYRDGH